MAIAQMEKVIVVTHRSQASELLEALQQEGICQILNAEEAMVSKDAPELITNAERPKDTENLLNRLTRSIEFLKTYAAPQKGLASMLAPRTVIDSRSYKSIVSDKKPLNIITIEDPVEYVVEGINQVQVNQKSGRSFSGCLRSILRQDPNVIMVGEIRETETAELALTASQTGRLLLSTVHAYDSISAITRLMELKIEPFLIASSLTGIISQRLVRKLCTCRRESSITPQYANRLKAAGIFDLSKPVYEPVGCIECNNTGYRGRLCTAEMLIVDEDIQNLIHKDAYHDLIRESARKNGFATLQEAAWEKVKLGLTSVEEIFRLIPFNDESAQRCHHCARTLSPEFMVCPFCGTTRTYEKSGRSRSSHLKVVPDNYIFNCDW